MALLLMSCGETARTEKDSTLEYDVIEIDSCEYIMASNPKRVAGRKVTSIAHKGNCKYCKERNNTEQINTSVEHKNVTDTILIYKYIKQE